MQLVGNQISHSWHRIVTSAAYRGRLKIPVRKLAAGRRHRGAWEKAVAASRRPQDAVAPWTARLAGSRGLRLFRSVSDAYPEAN